MFVGQRKPVTIGTRRAVPSWGPFKVGKLLDHLFQIDSCGLTDRVFLFFSQCSSFLVFQLTLLGQHSDFRFPVADWLADSSNSTGGCCSASVERPAGRRVIFTQDKGPLAPSHPWCGILAPAPSHCGPEMGFGAKH